MPYFGIPIRNGLPIGLGSVAGFGVAPAFSPSGLFAAGEQGAWYDPSDLTTLFQDDAGTTPTVMETRARLMLDKSKGLVLGPELVTNGDFSGGTTGWTVGASWVVSTGQAVTTSSSGYLIQSPFPAGDPIGATYQVTLVCSGVSGTVFIGGGQYTSTTLQNGTRTLYLQRTGTSNNILYIGTGGGNATIISISIKAIAGNHAVAPSDASSPILRARYNLLTYSEDFSNAAWLKSGVTVTPNATTAPDGTLTADLLSQDNSNAVHPIYQTITSQSGTCRVRISAKPGNGQNILQILKSGDVNGYANFDIGNGQLGTVGSSASNATITAAQNGFYECAVDLAAYGGFCFFMLAASASAGYYEGFQGSASNGIYIWGADLRTTTDAALNIPAYQSITTATSYDTSGFPPYLAVDGSDDSFSTASIDFTGTDKMTVFAGVTKLSDAAAGVLVELGTAAFSTVGGFGIYAPGGAAPDYTSVLRGNSNSRTNVATTYSAPVSNVVTLQFDIAQALTVDGQKTRVNGLTPTLTPSQASADYGGGTNANASLFIGRRNNTSLPLNGRIYSLIIRGAATTTPLIASTEQWVAGKMRLPI